MMVNPGIFARINEINSGRLEKKRGNPGKNGDKSQNQIKKKQIKKTKKEAKA